MKTKEFLPHCFSIFTCPHLISAIVDVVCHFLYPSKLVKTCLYLELLITLPAEPPEQRIKFIKTKLKFPLEYAHFHARRDSQFANALPRALHHQNICKLCTWGNVLSVRRQPIMYISTAILLFLTVIIIIIPIRGIVVVLSGRTGA